MNFLYDHSSIEPISDTFIRFAYGVDGEFIWQKYSLMILIGIALAVIFGIREGNKLGIKTNDIVDGILIIVPLSIVGTRLWYVIFEWGNLYWPVFQNDGFIEGIKSVANISSGGLAIHGGFITAFVSAYFYTKYKNINFFSAFDIMVPGFLIAQASGRWGNFFNQEAHGGVIGGTNDFNIANLTLDEQRAFLSDKLHLPDWITNQMYTTDQGVHGYNYFHPTFLYESVWNIIGFIIVLFVRRTKWLRNGDLFAFYLVWYGVGRFFIEGMRTDSLYVGDTGLRTAQLISIVMILGAVAYIVFTHKYKKVASYESVLADTKVIQDVVDGVTLPNETSNNLELPENKDGIEFVWESPKPKVINNTGEVFQKEKQQSGIITLTAFKEDIKVSKNFRIKVLPKEL